MHVNEVAALVLDYVISYLKTRPIGTKYHPKSNTFIIDGKTMARVMRHDGNLKATVPVNETNFFTRLMKFLEQEIEVDSMVTNNTYECKSVNNGKLYTLLVVKHGSIHLPKFLRKRSDEENGRPDNWNIYGKTTDRNGKESDGD